MDQRLLVVDDLQMNRRLLRAVLESEDYTVLDAADGVEALALLKKERVDAIISDILMPNMDGYRLCQEVRSDENLRSLPFLFYTSTYTSAEDERTALVCGGDLYLRKPAPASQIIASVRKLLEGRPEVNHAPAAAPDEAEVMQHYNAALVRKLEDKNAALTQARDRLSRVNEELERRVEERTADLREANEELDAFSQSIAHDLRAPLTGMAMLITLVEEDIPTPPNPEWPGHIAEIKDSITRMGQLVDDLLSLARASRGELHRESVDLSSLAHEVLEGLALRDPSRTVDTKVEPGLVVEGDGGLLRILLENLIGNAWKYSSRTERARIEVGRIGSGHESIYFVRDNGAGFDPLQASKLFQPFVRLHSASDFPGTGIGLTTVRRVVHRHGGRAWAEAAIGRGAAFYFTLSPSAPAA